MTKLYQKLNNIVGWLVFAIASIVYIITSEPTVSLWDCGEYIATAYKLQVGHPPGAPFFQLLGNVFSIFAFGNEQLIARMVNTMSALASSFSILFLFWSITMLAKKFLAKGEELNQSNMIAILGSGIVGALAYTFTDSFWFSAVEGEVYALSSFFTAFVFWAILKWETVADERHGYRWLILIAYMIGLSIGVHLLNLLAIPAITFVYYFKKYKPTPKGMIFTAILSIMILAVIMYIIIPYIVAFAGISERFFVNRLGMPFHSGTIFYFVLILGAIVYGLYFTQKHKKIVANALILGITFIIIGYSSFFILVVRSNANTPIDENNPEDALSLLAYLNREQYGDWPLFHGQYFNAPVVGYEDANPFYTKSYSVVNEEKLRKPGRIVKGKEPGLIKIFSNKKDAEKFIEQSGEANYSIKQSYVVTDERKDKIPVYDDRFTTIFPRMWSNQRENHPSFYRQYMKDKSKKVSIPTSDGKTQYKTIPSFGDNLRYFFQYQIGHMYMRYFMWNFAGRQNNLQGFGDNLRGNWISGIDFIDEARLGPQGDALPIELQNNPGTNKYFFLPLILGLIGLYFQFSKRYKDGIVVSLLFLMTGLAIVVYLNQYPNQPRERDYAYAASFYAFAIWIGLGVFAIYDMLKKYISAKLLAVGATVVGLSVPAILAQQNWDDHDRSGRYNTLHIAKNYLNSCEPNAILFTNGDNDTFPLWYAQEVEGIRTDIKIVNLSLYNTDWYVDQMVRKTYDAEPIPISIEREKYIQGTNDVAYFIPNPKVVPDGIYVDIKEVMNYFWSDDSRSKFTIPNSGEKINYFPTQYVKIPVDKQKVLANGTVAEKDSSLILNELNWKINENVIQKNHLMMMELIANFDWERPIYFAITTGADTYLHLMKFFQLDGMTYRLVPIEHQFDRNMGDFGRIDTDILYDKLMNVFIYDDIVNHDVYLDEYHMHSIRNYRSNFGRLASALVAEGDFERAKEVVDKAFEVLPEERVPYDYFVAPLAEVYYKIGEKEKAQEVLNRLVDIFTHDLSYYYGAHAGFKEYNNQKRNALFIVQQCAFIASEQGDDEMRDIATEALAEFNARFQAEN